MPNDIALKIENLSKQYRLGVVGTNTLRGDLQAWWYRMRGKEDPTLKIGEENKLAESGGKYIWALEDINLEVKKGEVLGIIGKNGAGKSTLLKILSRVTGPTTGKVEINGSIASLLEVGTGMHPELTGKENIYLNGAILGMTKAEIRKKIDEIIDFAGVAKYMDTPVKRYSSGMRVRLGFAVAAFLEPDILVVDEVLAVGDAEFQKKAIGKMQDVSQGEGRTVLFVSHNMDSVRKLCTSAIIIENGLISFHGQTDTAIEEYLVKEMPDNTYRWVNPNTNTTDDFIPVKICFSGSEAKKQNLFTKYKSKATFQFSFILKKKIKALTIGYSLFDSKDTLLYRTLNTDVDDNYMSKLRIGYNTIASDVPIEILNKGLYCIAIDVSIFRTKSIINPLKERIGIFFEVEDDFQRSKYWDIKRTGILAPSIKWEVVND